MRVLKCVQQRSVASGDVADLMGTYRRMVNDCIRIGLQENVSSLKALSLKWYPYLKRYDVLSYYRLCAISRASGILKNYRGFTRKGKNPKTPYVWRPQLVTCYGFKVKEGKLLLPSKPGERIEVPLNSYTRRVLAVADLQVRSITLTPDRLSFSVAKNVEPVKPAGVLGVDCNLANVTTASSSGPVARFDLSRAVSVRQRCTETKSHMKRNDAKVRQRIYQKYGEIQKNRVRWILHNASKHLVKNSKKRKLAIIMEDLKGIRNLYLKGNGQGRWYRGLLNGWMFREFQRQVEYKARWEGLPVHHVHPHGSSAKCSRCGHKLLSEENRTQTCLKCSFHVDRDVNAALNIAAKGTRFMPVASPSEAMVAESPTGNPHSRWRLVKLDRISRRLYRTNTCVDDLQARTSIQW